MIKQSDCVTKLPADLDSDLTARTPVPSDYPRAYVTTGPDGQLILVDPDAAAVIQGIEAHNQRVAVDAFCKANADRIPYFAGRILARGLSHMDVVIVVLDVDDGYGAEIADMLMPGHDWQSIRDRGEHPVARGLAERDSILDVVDRIVPGLGTASKTADYTLAVVVTAGTAAIFRA